MSGNGGGFSTIQSLFGTMSQQAAEERARKELEAILAEYDGISLPEYEQMLLEQLGPSALEGVRTDAQGLSAQRSALERLRSLSESGTDAAFDAQMNEALSRANANEARTRAGIVDRAASSGGLGGGQALAMQMAAQQEGARRAQQASLDAAAQNQMRAYQALRDSSSLGGQMRQQGWAEDSQRAQAADAIARQNLALRQQRTMYNNDLASRRYGDQMQKTAAKSNARLGLAQSERNRGDLQKQFNEEGEEVIGTIARGATGGY